MRERYIHYKNKKEYEIVNKCKIQENEKWIEAVIYKEKEKDIINKKKESKMIDKKIRYKKYKY